jgi:hypothetical protein
MCAVVTQGFTNKEEIQSSSICWEKHVYHFWDKWGYPCGFSGIGTHQVFLQRDNAWPHTSILTRETTADIQVDSSPHLPYSIYLAL